MYGVHNSVVVDVIDSSLSRLTYEYYGSSSGGGTNEGVS